MTRPVKLLVIAVVVLVVGVGGVALWFSLRGDAPDPVALSTESTGEDDAADGTDSGDPIGDGGSDDDATDGADPDGVALDGRWEVEPGETSLVGYRVGEELLGGVGRSTAVGRTGEVAGHLTIDGTTITTVDVEADMTSLRSDEDRRDNRLRTSGLETDSFPTATFVLTEPIELGSTPDTGETVEVAATGDLTLHGVTRSVDLPLEAVLRPDGRIEVVGRLPIVMAEWDITPPSISGFVTVEDEGELELQLAFAPA
jgi:polyisoprenoid-binding protein YceI